MTERFADRFADLIPALQEPYDATGRAYHNWSHMQSLLNLYQDLLAVFRDPATVEIALYYHGVIYVPGSKANESDSAEAMIQELSGRARAEEITAAATIINATAVHAVPDGTNQSLAEDCALFLDMDLAILSTDAATFDAYDHNIRQEFSMVPDEIYHPGRRKIMQSFLERDRIYLTDRFHVSHDARARETLRRLVERLS